MAKLPKEDVKKDNVFSAIADAVAPFRRMMRDGKGGAVRNVRIRLTKEQRRGWNLPEDTEFVAWDTPDGLLIRPADPPLAKVYIEPTTNCNLNCRTCMRNTWSEPGGEMSMETYGRLLDGLRGAASLRTMSFWGIGEPLANQNILEMLRLAKMIGARTEMVTNGLLLTREMSAGLVAAGLDRLVVSIDGATRESNSEIRTGADLATVQENIRMLNAMRLVRSQSNPEVGIEFVVMRRNISELKYLPGLARGMGASFIIVSNLLPYTEELKDDILYWLSAGDNFPSARSRWNPEITMARIDARRENLDLMEGFSSYVAATHRRTASPNGADGYCPFVWDGSAAVAWDGSVSPCVGLMHSHTCFVLDREKSIKKYVLGNVNRYGINKIWNGAEYRKFRKRVREFDFAPCVSCGGCEYAESNEEDCFGSPFPACGDCLWARGIVLCP
jgi:MoaA/NifB/PqqE/SkfB family radical SAM enzyme